MPTVSCRVRTLLCVENTLRRMIAALLALFFGAGPLLPALAVGRAQNEIPACCRKNGAHKCSVPSGEKPKTEQNGKPGLRALCPFPSHAISTATALQSFIPPSPAKLRTGVVPQRPLFNYKVAIASVVSFPGNPKRGPPQPLL